MCNELHDDDYLPEVTGACERCGCDIMEDDDFADGEYCGQCVWYFEKGEEP